MGKIVQKNYRIYKYIFRPVPQKNIQLSIHVRMNEYAHITTTINLLMLSAIAVVAQAAKALHIHSSPRAVVGSESQSAGQVLEVSK